MFRRLLTASIATAFMLGAVSPAFAAPCRDARGKFAKCPKPAAQPMRCRNAKGRFAKCGTAGAKPA